MPLTDQMRLDGKVVAVIGAASGIGKAVSHGCAEVGATVHCLDLDESVAKEVATHIRKSKGIAHGNFLDLRNTEQVSSSLNRIHEIEKRLDVMICTPSINVRKTLLDYTDQEFDRVVELNLKGAFIALRETGRIMTAQQSGSIILYSSIRSQVVEPGQSVYAATKAGIVQLVKTAAAEFAENGVRVNAIAPGIVKTPLTAQISSNELWYRAYAEKSALGRWAETSEMVGPAVFLSSNSSSYITGTVLYVDGGWTAIDGRFKPPGT